MLLKVKPGIPLKLDESDNPTFEEWERRVGAFVWRAAGCSLRDLPDCQYYNWYEHRVRPVRAAARALKAAGAGGF